MEKIKLIIQQINNKWTVNNKEFAEMSIEEKILLANFIKNYNSK